MVAAAVAAVVPAGPEGKHGSYVDADEKYHRRETNVAAAAAAAAYHRRETSVAAAAAAAACHRRETNVCCCCCCCRGITPPQSTIPLSLRESPPPPTPPSPKPRPTTRASGFGGSLAHPPPALVFHFSGPCVGRRRNK